MVGAALTLPALELRLAGTLRGQLVQQAPDYWSYRPLVAGPPAGLGAFWSIRQLTSITNQETANVRAWFRHLLPDASVCHQLAQRLGFSVGNDFALLGALGADAPGALSLRWPGARSADPPGCLTVAEVAALLVALRAAQPPPRIAEATAPGDAGCVPLCQTAQGWWYPTAERPSNVWLRAGRHGWPDAVHNEAFCLGLAARAGVPVLASEWVQKPLPCLITARSDRQRSGPEPVLAWVHEENFGQIAGLAPEQAFEREGGLALRDCVALMRRHSAVPALDLRTLLRWVVFNHLVGNGLATARDLRFHYTAQGPRLAPFANLLSTHVYAQVSERLGMMVGQEDRPDWIRPARWRGLAQELDLNAHYVLALVGELALAMPGWLAAQVQAWQATNSWSPVLAQVRELVLKRARQLAVSLAAERA
ncbi:MAG: type II toxin-antitoxin system HipA family toxin [Gammaproteobacteria bacterium]|nr:type II toxin-antitoxin system HipA family toxin [Gammaproteobacteria bacterium]